MKEKFNILKEGTNCHNLKHSSWLFPSSVEEAKKSQFEMAQQVILQDQLPFKLTTIAGVDVSNNPFDYKKSLDAAIVLLSYPSLELMETQSHHTQQSFPYIPGLLGFREAPALLKAFEKLSIKPDLLLVDGHGVSHPRALGIASHLGVLLDIPTIGVAKSILVGSLKNPLKKEVLSTTSLIWNKQEIAMVVRTKKNCSPLIISAGHKISLTKAVEVVLSCLKGYKLPEPTRRAHLAANQCRLLFKTSSHLN